MQLYSAATYIPIIENPSEYEAQSTSGSVVTKVAIPAPQKSNFRVAFAPERMAMNMTIDPLVRVIARRATSSMVRCVIEDPSHPDCHYHISECWLLESPPAAEYAAVLAPGPICLSLPALDRIVQLVLAKEQARRVGDDDSAPSHLGSDSVRQQGRVEPPTLPAGEAACRESDR